MWHPRLLAVLVGVCLSCVNIGQQAAVHHQARVAEINRRYDDEAAATRSRWEPILVQIDANIADAERAKLAVIPGTQSQPVDRVDGDSVVNDFAAQCRSFDGDVSNLKAKGADPAPMVDLRDQCWSKFREFYGAALAKRYYKADWTWVAEQANALGAAADVESLLTYSHNTMLTADLLALRVSTAVHLQERLAQLDESRRAEIDASDQQRVEEIRAGDRRRRAALAAAFSAFGSSMQQSTSRMQTRPGVTTPSIVTTTATPECDNDYQCGIGFVCVKNNYLVGGTCARSVNAYGVQQFNMPSPDSVRVKMPSSTDCHVNTQCPVGFRCDVKSGACVR